MYDTAEQRTLSFFTYQISTMIQRMPPTQTDMLLALARYKFLTTSQMILLGISKHRSNISKHLKELREGKRPFVGRMEFGTHPKQGRLEDFYYLTPRAKKSLMDGLQMQADEIQLPIGTSTLFNNDYFHRKFTIDCQIATYQMAEQKGWEVLFFERYFDKTGSNRKGGTSRAKTKIDMDDGHYLIADGVFMIEKEEIGDRDLYCFEMYNGKDTKRVHKQLRQYVQAFANGSPSIKYNHRTPDGSRYKGSRVLCVFEHASCMEAVVQRIETDPLFAHMRELFLFEELGKAWTP